MDDSQYATIDEIKNFSPALKHKILQAEATGKSPKKAPAPPPPATTAPSAAIQLEYLQEEPPPLPPLPPPNHHRHHSQKSSSSSPKADSELRKKEENSSPMLKARSLDAKPGGGSDGESPFLAAGRPKAGRRLIAS